jgi:CheY-like chemotaxis protein
MAHYPKRVLIVEDNKIDMKLMKDILERSEYETLQAEDGLEAINLALATLPDLILMDICNGPGCLDSFRGGIS